MTAKLLSTAAALCPQAPQPSIDFDKNFKLKTDDWPVNDEAIRPPLNSKQRYETFWLHPTWPPLLKHKGAPLLAAGKRRITFLQGGWYA